MRIARLKKLFWLLHILLVAGLLGTIFAAIRDRTRDLAGPSPAEKSSTPAVLATPAPAPRALNDYALVWTTFAPPPAPEVTSRAVRPRPNLTMVGIAYSPSPSKPSCAIIRDSKGATRSYKVGDEIDEVKIVAIGPDYAEMDDHGSRFRLMLQKGGAPLPPRTSTTVPGPNPPVTPPIPPVAIESQEVSPGHWFLSPTEINQAVEKTAELLTQIRVKPHFDAQSQSMDGLQFLSIDEGSLFSKRGFKTGDVIKSVNEKPVNSIQEAINIYNQLKDVKRFVIEVVRDGKARQLTYEIR